MSHTAPESADQDAVWNDIAATELENEVDLICEDGYKLVVASPSCSSRSPRGSIELSPYPNNRQSQSDRRSKERRDACQPHTHTPIVRKEKLIQQSAEAATKGPREQQQEDEEEEKMTAVVEGRKVGGELQQGKEVICPAE